MNKKIFFRSFLVFAILVVILFSGCSTPPKVRTSKIAYMEIFIPSKFVPEEMLKDINKTEFKVYIDYKPHGSGLKLKKSAMGGYYTVLNPYKNKMFTESMSDTCIPFAEGWHEITLTRKYKGEELPVPVRLTGKKGSRYKDEPKEGKIEKMFVSNEGPGGNGQYYVQFSLIPCKDFPSSSNLKIKKATPIIKKYGSVSLSSMPKAEVYLDNDFVGMTPIAKLKIETGKHTIEIKKNGYVSWIKEIRILSDSHVPIEVIMDKESYVNEDWKPKTEVGSKKKQEVLPRIDTN